jgi:hypothetical protein
MITLKCFTKDVQELIAWNLDSCTCTFSWLYLDTFCPSHRSPCPGMEDNALWNADCFNNSLYERRQSPQSEEMVPFRAQAPTRGSQASTHSKGAYWYQPLYSKELEWLGCWLGVKCCVFRSYESKAGLHNIQGINSLGEICALGICRDTILCSTESLSVLDPSDAAFICLCFVCHYMLWTEGRQTLMQLWKRLSVWREIIDIGLKLDNTSSYNQLAWILKLWMNSRSFGRNCILCSCK